MNFKSNLNYHSASKPFDSSSLQVEPLKIAKATLIDSNPESSFQPAKEAGFIAFIILILFQSLDGLFTLYGVDKFGPDVEANPIIRTLIIDHGSFFAITAAKSLTIIAILFLWSLRRKVEWIIKSFHFMCIYYLFFALIPWTILISQDL